MKTKRVGELLQEERERRHLTVTQVATYTHIKPEFIQALENNTFAGLPPAPFVRGFVRTLCVTLGLKPENVIPLLRRDFKEEQSGHLLPNTSWSRRRPKLFGGVVGGMSIVVISVAVVSVGYVLMQWFASTQPPYLDVASPEPFSEHSGQTLVSGTTDIDAVVTINGQQASLRPDGSFSLDVDLPAGGLVTLRVQAEDSLGKSSVVEIPVRVVGD